MSKEQHRLINVWEDTVDLRELLIGLALGSALGFACYRLSFWAFTKYLTGQSSGVIKGYALLGGIAGCVCAAVIVALVFKPKRWLRASDEGPDDRAQLLSGLALDPDEERRALEEGPPKLIREMEQLQIYDLFADFSRSRREAD